jgi:hypothetical protein
VERIMFRLFEIILGKHLDRLLAAKREALFDNE